MLVRGYKCVTRYNAQQGHDFENPNEIEKAAFSVTLLMYDIMCVAPWFIDLFLCDTQLHSCHCQMLHELS